MPTKNERYTLLRGCCPSASEPSNQAIDSTRQGRSETTNFLLRDEGSDRRLLGE
jgi:hypothetical protein